MVNITASMVKELRERTGVGMMDCKKALNETEGNLEEAIKYLKEKGLAKAAKKAGRIAAEGVVSSVITPKQGILIEVNCETDFTARNDNFLEVANKVSNHVLETAQSEGSVIEVVDGYDETVQDIVTQAVAKIGENIRARRYVKLNAKDNSMLHSYIHMGGKIGVIIEVSSSNNGVLDNADVVEMADDISMHIAAMNPACIDESEFPKDKLEAEKDIFRTQALESGKPESIVEKMIVGRVKKFVAENTLLEQAFVKNSDVTVKQFVAETGKKVGAELKVERIFRFELGEGIEKKQENFAEEVAKQMQ